MLHILRQSHMCDDACFQSVTLDPCMPYKVAKSQKSNAETQNDD